MGSKRLLQEYEERFVQVREAVTADKQQSEQRIEGLLIDVNDQEYKISKLEMRVQELVDERSQLNTSLKEESWARDRRKMVSEDLGCLACC